MTIFGLPSLDVDWRRPLSKYLRFRTIPDNKTKIWCLACQAKGYLTHNSELYRRSTSGILEPCVPIEEGRTLLLAIHEGVCGHHACNTPCYENPKESH
jgi:hypothetical protein